MIQNILLVGGDERAARLKPLLAAQGYMVQTLGIASGDDKTVNVAAADALLFPYPFSVKNGIIPTHDGLTLYPADVLERAAHGAVVLAGAGLETAVAEANAHGAGFKLRLYAQHEPFVQANADISAEATAYEVMGQTAQALSDLTILVTGYGRYGQSTAKRLLALGATVWVAARRDKQRLLASSDGMRALSIEDIPSIAGEIDVLVNTVPARILSVETLKRFSKECRLLEVASAPYGFDREAAEALGLHCQTLPGLPARYAPGSAAKALMRACIRLLTEAES